MEKRHIVDIIIFAIACTLSVVFLFKGIQTEKQENVVYKEEQTEDPVGQIEDTQTEEYWTEEDYGIEYMDVDKFYHENGTVLATFTANTSKQMQTESQVIEFLQERGFEILEYYPINVDYTADGDFVEKEIITGSDEKHPIYQMSYVSANDELWSIIIINGSVTATNVSYSFEYIAEDGAQMVISETEAITCYDSVENKFYEVVPDESSVIVKVVDRIDAAMLDQLTVEVLKEL